MNRRQKIFYFLIKCVFILSLAVCINAQSASGLAESVKYERQATDFYRQKDYVRFLENIRQASDLRPNHPRLLYNLADAYALNGKPRESLRILTQIAAMDLFFAVDKDDDFKALYNLPEFERLLAEFKLNQKPVNRSRRTLTIPQKNLITEGIAYDTAAQRFFVSSVYLHKIVSIDKSGKVTDFSSPSDGLWSVLGMKIDAARHLLWVTTAALPQMDNFQKTDDGRSGVFKYDLRSGKLLKKYLLPFGESEKHALGDLVVGKNGDVFASDSISPVIYRISVNRAESEVFIKNGTFASLQGLAFSPDEKFLFVADYSSGIFKIRMRDKQITTITPDANTNLIGTDGLYFHRGNLIATQNGFAPSRVVRFFLNKDFSRIVKSETLEANHADFNDPTLGVIIKDDFYYIANGQWSLFGKNGELDESQLKEPVVLRLKI